jgi:hypothetical protein
MPKTNTQRALWISFYVLGWLGMGLLLVHPMALGWVCAGAAGAIAVAACELRSPAPAKPSHNTLRMEEL